MTDPKSTEPTSIEYQVRVIKRYTVTRFYAGENTGGVEQKGEYDNPTIAYEVGYALCKAEHERLGWPLADDRIRYPSMPEAQLAPDGSKDSEGVPRNVAA